MAANLLCSELLDKIFSFLSRNDLCAVSQVCPAWKEVAKLTLRRRISFKTFERNGEFEFHVSKLEPQLPTQLVVHERWRTSVPITEASFVSQNRIVIRSASATAGFSRNPALPLLALMAFKSEWCKNVAEIYLGGVSFESLNAAGSSIFSLFPSVQRIMFCKLVKWDSETCKFIHFASISLDLAPETKSDSVSELDPPERKWQGHLCFDDRDRTKKLTLTLLLTAAAMHEPWCSNITRLEFKGDVALQDWNIAGRLVSNNFSNLELLFVNLVWIPDYVSETQVVEDVQTSRVVDEVGDEKSGIPKGPEPKKQMEHRQSDLNKMLLMLMNMSADACNKVTHLTIGSELPVQDWNVVGSYVLSSYPRLKRLSLNLVLVPAYVSTVETRGFPAQAETSGIEELHIELKDVGSRSVLAAEPRKPRPPLAFDFVSHCPKLQRLSVIYLYDELCFYDEEHCMGYEWSSTGQHTFRLIHDKTFCWSDDHAVSVCAAVLPLINTLPMTTLHLEKRGSFHHLQLLQHLDVDTVQKLTSLQVCISLFSYPKHSGLHFQCLVGVLNRRGCQSLVDLELTGSDDHDLGQHALRDFGYSTEMQLPTVKRLRLDQPGTNYFSFSSKPELNLFYNSLVTALPNVEELTVKFSTFYHERFGKTSEFLEHSAGLPKLRSLKWEWDSECRVQSLAKLTGCFSIIQNNLAKHQALETLKISWGKNLDLKYYHENIVEMLKAAIRGCGTVPSMRLITIGSLDGKPGQIKKCLQKLRRIAPRLQLEIQS